MSTVNGSPHYSIPADALAKWLDDQPETWWSVDGDPWLMSEVDFPCPSDELSAAIRQVGKPILVFDVHRRAHGEDLDIAQLDSLADRENRRHARTFLCTWDGDDVDWLLVEDEPMT